MEQPQPPQNNILKRVTDRVEECFQIAEKYYGEPIPRCRVTFDLKGTKGGVAFFKKRLLRFNRVLLLQNPDEYFNSTCPHEVAHIVQRFKFGYDGVKSHGKEWRTIMLKIFGLSPKVTHKMDTSSITNKTRPYKYTCNCMAKTFMLSSIKHRRILRGNQYACPKCHAPLVFQGKVSGLPQNAAPKFREEILD